MHAPDSIRRGNRLLRHGFLDFRLRRKQQEQQYLAALSTAATYRIDGSNLELRTADGALAANFTKATK